MGLDKKQISADLNRWDDLPFHQTVASLGRPSNSDSHFNDGYYFAFYGQGHHFFMGLRLHPNNNVLDGYVGVVCQGKQRSQRFSRALLPARDSLVVGPLSVEIVEPMQRQRVTLVDSQINLKFDLQFDAVGDPFVEAEAPQIRFGRVINHLIRYTQPARANGYFELDGKRVDVADWFGARDHSWGIRSTMGPYVPHGGSIEHENENDMRALRLWVPFEVGDHSGFFHLHEDSDGVVLDSEGRIDFKDGTSRNIVRVVHQLKYLPQTTRLCGGTIDLILDNGQTHQYQISDIYDPAHPQGFGYARGWVDGGQPGVYRGRYHTEHEEFSVVSSDLATGPDHVPVSKRLGGTEFACVFQHESGWGMAHVEHMIYRKYLPYGLLLDS